MERRAVRVAEVFDANPVTSSFQLRICAVCFLLVVLDGFDLFIIGVAAPKIIAYLHCKPSAFGLAMSANQVSSILGAIFWGMLADRAGRKWTLVMCSFIFGLFTLLTVWITTVEQLALLRFIAGIGLGGAVTNALAFGSEYAPTRLRKTFASTMFAGMPAGALLGGLLAAWAIPHLGWQSLFAFGGIAPMAVAAVAAGALPESLEFLTAKRKDQARIRKIVAKITPAFARDEQIDFYPSEKKVSGGSVKNLFTEKRAPMTILFWLALAGSFYFVLILIIWMPTMLHMAGATPVQYSLAYAAMNVGGTLGTILCGRFMDRRDPYKILAIGFVMGYLGLTGFGLIAGGSFFVIVLVAIYCGFFISGAQDGTMALTAVSYPPDIRGTAVGWGYAAAKVGSWFAPVVGGYLLSAGWSVPKICSVNAFAGLFCAGIMLVLKSRAAAAERLRVEASVAV
jgi:AAHS family 4-hydroxybenzoate transporter-like MFS transporter